ncbi:MAG: long-chain-fatty-acid--CoA ligase [Gammaproteobacteria bacterium]|nr:MAG: long-chain-fatty-acid--CoA ligase [Gammaproteobacteria bacterium]
MTAIQSVADFSRTHARERPNHPALLCRGETTTYGELDARASQVAQGLRGLGLAVQSRVGFLAKNDARYFEIILGCAKARMTIVGVNTRLAPPEMRYVLDDARAEVLIVGREFYDTVEALEAEFATVRTVIALDGGHPRWPAYAEWRTAQSAEDPQLAVEPEDDIQQLYTSGTTGHPKGVQITQGQWVRFAEAVLAAGWARYSPDDTIMVCMPVFHVAGANGGLLALMQGARVLVVADIVPEEIFRLIPEHRVNYTLFVPAVILMLVSQPGVEDVDFSSLRCITYGASPIAESLLERAREIFGCDFIQLYGLTENLGGATYLPAEDHGAERNKLRSCGKPYPGAEIRIVDGEGRDLPTGEVGEIAIHCGWLMKGYWQNPEATAAALREGWFLSGDAGYVDEEGYVYIHDRIKDMIVSGGENVYPAEVENALFSHPDVADVAVIGVPDERWGEAVKAIVVPRTDSGLTAEALIAHARERIAGYKLPKSVDFVAALPRNPSGKVLRRELRRDYWEGHDRQVS